MQSDHMRYVARSRAIVDALERRLFLSASVSFDGATLRITGDDGKQTIRIVEQAGITGGRDAATRLWLDANGNGSLTDPGDLVTGYQNVQRFDIRTKGGDDGVEISLYGQYSAGQRNIDVNLGDGNDTFRFGANSIDGSPRIDGSTLNISVVGGDGNDNVRTSFCRIIKSTVNVSLDLGRGDDVGGFGLNYPVSGTFTAKALLGDGKDSFDVHFDAEDNFSLPADGLMNLEVHGGAGQDVLTAQAYSGWRTAWVNGTLHLNLLGEADGDYIAPDLKNMAARGSGVLDVQTDGSDIPDPRPKSQWTRASGRVYHVDTRYQFPFNELAVPGVTLFVDANDNGRLDAGEQTTTTSDTGLFEFRIQPPGIYTIRIIAPQGWHLLSPESDDYTVGAEGNSSCDFMLQTTGICGTVRVYSSDDRTGSPAGSVVFLDANLNGTADPGERRVVVDASGYFAFLDLSAAGTYSVGCIPPSGWAIATGEQASYTVDVSDGQVRSADFYVARSTPLAGHVFYDPYVHGEYYAGGSGLPGIAVFLDGNGNHRLDPGETRTTTDAEGAYSFGQLPLGTYTVAIVPPAGWISVKPAGFSSTVTVAADRATPPQSFALHRTGLHGSVARPSGRSFSIADILVYLDLNNNSAVDAGEPSTTTDASGSFHISAPPAGTYPVRMVIPDALRSSYTGNDSRTVTVSPGAVVPDVPLFLTAVSQSIAGIVFSDINRNGWQDDRERSSPELQWQGETELGIRGITVFLDTNNDGVRNSGEPATATDAYGSYTFLNLPSGSYTVRVQPSAGWAIFSPTSSQYVVSVNSATFYPAIATRSFALTSSGASFPPHNSSLTGTLFDDRNGNGQRDASGEAGLAGVTVFLDQNENGQLDSGEPSTTTDASGAYSFGSLASGHYTLSVVPPVGWLLLVPTTGLRSVYLGSAQTIADLDFGLQAYIGAGEITGTPGADNIKVSAATTTDPVTGKSVQGVQVTINGQAGLAFVPEGHLLIYGGDGNDRIAVDNAVSVPMLIYGGDGDDTILGGAGADTIYGNTGNDSITAGGGADSVMAGLGNDTLYGGAMADTLLAGDGSDVIYAGVGNDYIEGRGKADTIRGGAGNDTIWGGAGSDWIDAGEGDDWVDVGAYPAFTDSVYGGGGSDTVQADQGDLLEGVEVKVIG